MSIVARYPPDVQGFTHTGQQWLAQPPLRLVLHHRLSIKSAEMLLHFMQFGTT